LHLYGRSAFSLVFAFALSLEACALQEVSDLPPNRLQSASSYLVLNETNIKCASAENSIAGRYRVSLDFSPRGAKWFQNMTASSVGKPFDFVLNGKVVVSPNINEPILGNSIAITGRSENDTSEIQKWLKTLTNTPKCSHSSHAIN